jgi:iduronate 2-sulfatase
MVEWKKPGAAPETADLELYDYETDPGETRNFASEQPQEVSRLRAILSILPEAKPQISAKPADNREAMFARRDTNGDGKLTREEFLLNQPDPQEAPKRFMAFDTDKDGVLSKEEFVTMGGKAKR